MIKEGAGENPASFKTMNLQQISINSIIPSKENIKTVSESLIVAVQDGHIDPLELVVKLAAIQEVCEQVRKGIEDNVLIELSKNNGKAIVFDADVSRKETGVKYDYTMSAAWNKFSTEKESIDKKLKDVEKMAKAMPYGSTGSYTDTETGETMEVVSAEKTSKTTFAITLKK